MTALTTEAPEAPEVDAAPAKSSESKAKALYSEAKSLLMQKHADEFEEILTGLYEREGLVRRRRLSAEERAAKRAQEAEERAAEKIRALLAEHPGLAEKITA